MKLISFSIILPMFAVSLLGMAMILTLGFIHGNLFHSVEITSGVFGALVAPILMLSGVLFPLHILPNII